jgi:hypothetical protein
LTTLVILVLIAIWATVLMYPILRFRMQGGFGDSIGTFRRHLTVLERAAPNSVSPANRLRLPQSSPAVRPYGRWVRARTGPPSQSVGGRRYPPPVALARRHKLQKRRRDVLFTLVAGIIGSFLLGLIPGLSMMLFVCAGFVLLFAGYVGLLVRLHHLATERQMRLAFLPAAAPAQIALGVSAAGRQRIFGRGGYALPDGYPARSDLLMRQPAN